LASDSTIVKRQGILIRRLEENYVLCKYCLRRQLSVDVDANFDGHNTSGSYNTKECHICSGLMDESESIVKRIREILDDNYHFDTFLIGAALPAYLYEKEDRIRARFKIRGRENIKSQFMRDLRKKFRECTKKQIDFLYPDIVINLQFEKETTLDINIKMRPMIILGRYVKKNRGIPQRKGGDYIGCDDINVQNETSPSINVTPPLPASTALAVRSQEVTSIQSILSREILKITKGERLKFSWIGSEDEESLVSGSGRPFFLQVLNPKTIRLNKRRLNFPRYGLFVNIERYFKKLPEQPVQFIAKTRIVIQSSRQLGEEEVLKIKSLADSIVVFPNQKNKSRSSTKRIYSVDVMKIENRVLELHLVAEGGLAIKQFVEGREYISPNLSTAANLQCECLFFDILDVWIKEY
jgi:tRNA pseudouridine synthase 10